MDFKLELVLIPVTDVDRAKAFYTETAGFNLDVDHRASDVAAAGHRVQRGVLLLDALEGRGGDLDRRERAASVPFQQLGRAHP